ARAVEDRGLRRNGDRRADGVDDAAADDDGARIDGRSGGRHDACAADRVHVRRIGAERERRCERGKSDDETTVQHFDDQNVQGRLLYRSYSDSCRVSVGTSRPAITTWVIVVRTSSGSPFATIRFAILPGSMLPMRSPTPRISAALIVTALSASSRASPHATASAA